MEAPRSAPRREHDEPTVKIQEHRFVERTLNRACSVAHSLGLKLTSWDTDQLMEEAAQHVGADDFGNDRFIEVWKTMLDMIEAQGEATHLARAFMRGVSQRALAGRLRTEAYFRQHPEAADIPIEKPVFVLGFPRTGTTVIQNLLAQEPGRRYLPFWELTNPVPLHTDPRRDLQKRMANANRDLKLVYLCVPELPYVHFTKPDSAEECWYLFQNTFAVLNYDLSQGVEAFGPWLMDYDMEWVYREYRRQLQIILHRNPATNLVLKCPEHLWFLDDLIKVFPDACVVWTHRDPLDSVASYSSMVSLTRRTLYGRFDPLRVGPHTEERFLQGVNRAMDVRDANPDFRIFDVRFDDLVRNQAGIVKQICEFFQLPYTAEGDRLVNDWLTTPRKDSKGKHRYHADRYGLVAGDIDERYARYIQRFDVVLHR